VADGVHVVAKRPEICANPPNPDTHHIDQMMFLKKFPITVRNGLKGITIPANLPKFIGSPNENLVTHVEGFIKVLIISLITDHDYYFIWFLSTLADFVYAWYRSHVVDLSTFGNNSKLHSYAIMD
jgi:hypothetical protein